MWLMPNWATCSSVASARLWLMPPRAAAPKIDPGRLVTGAPERTASAG